jgi:hypothetical protein
MTSALSLDDPMRKTRQGRKALRIEDVDDKAGACRVCGKLRRRLHRGVCSECETFRKGTEPMKFEDAK